MSKELTVRELLEQLQNADPNLPIETEGCDCVGGECGVVIEKDRVYITRDNHDD